MPAPTVEGGINIAMKIPADRFDETVAFYRDTLGFALTEEDVTQTPSLSRSFSLRFGPVVLWLDSVDPGRAAEVWLEMETDDVAAAREHLASAGTQTCDEVEPAPGVGERMHWIRNPAGVVHLLNSRPAGMSAAHPAIGGIAALAIDCADPPGLAAYWQRLLGGELVVDEEGDAELRGAAVRLDFLRVPDHKSTKNRLHLDLRASDFDQAVEAALAAGATPADDIYDGGRWKVLRDPEGNEFCILRP